MTQNKTFLVTGGAGFIGSHLCERLLSDGHRVMCVDNLCTGSMGNITDFMGNPCFTFIEHDIVDSLINVTQEKVDRIYNLACPASPVHYQRDPVKTLKTNTIGVMNVLEFAKSHKARILQASTSEVYGNPLEHPQHENYWGNVNSIGPRACYDEGKRVAEAFCYDYRRQHDTDIRVVRIFNTYGPRMAVNDGRMIPNFIVQALRGKDITVYGDGSQTRSLQYIDDLINGMICAMEHSEHTPFNLGNPIEYPVLGIAQKIIELTESKSKVVFSPLPEDDPIRRRPDIAKAKSVLRWEPRVMLEQGLKETVKYFRQVI